MMTSTGDPWFQFLFADRIGGAHGAVVTAVAQSAFEQAIGMLRPAGTVSIVGLPGGDKDGIRTSIAALVNGELSIRGSSVGTRQDLAEAIDFSARGLVTSKVERQPLTAINDVFARMRKGEIVGRVVLQLS